MAQIKSQLKHLRLSMGLGVRPIAEKIRISHTAYLRYEHGTSIPRKETGRNMELLFGVAIEALWKGIEETWKVWHGFGPVPKPVPKLVKKGNEV